jgi:hypothetical protein
MKMNRKRVDAVHNLKFGLCFIFKFNIIIRGKSYLFLNLINNIKEIIII